MRILMTGTALLSMLLVSGCAMPSNPTLHAYPSFGTLGGGRLVVYHRSTTGNLLPAARDVSAKQSSKATDVIR